MIKKINIFFNREIPWSYPDNVEGKKNNNNNINQLIKDLIKLAPNKEAIQQLLDDLNKLTEEEKQELEKFYNQEIKPELNNLKEHLNKELDEKLKQKIKELYNKIKELSNKHEKSPEKNEEIRTIKVQLALLKQAFSQSKNNVW